jgi:hypothetical protein
MALVLRNRLTAHDGPVSVLRAYTRPELRALAGRAGLEHVLFHKAPFRMTMTASKAGDPVLQPASRSAAGHREAEAGTGWR